MLEIEPSEQYRVEKTRHSSALHGVVLTEGTHAMSQLELKIDLRGLGTIVKDGRLRVPRYQRSYAWKKQNVEQFLDDIAGALEEHEPEYFLGSIVVAGANGDIEVVDGQQRIATTIILAAAIRDQLLIMNEKERAEEIASDYLAKVDRRSLDLKPQLYLNDVDHPFFQEAVLRTPSDDSDPLEPQRESHKRILAAMQLARDRASAIAKSAGNNAVSKLLDWTDYLDTKAKVIEVRVRDDANAFTIFETLNDRGLTLAISDLLKNFLFSRAEGRISEVQAAWLAMQGVLETVSDDDVVVDFIRHVWSYQYGLTREKQLYKRIKDKTKTKNDAVRLATTLEKTAHIYASLLNPNSKLWREHEPSSKLRVAALNLMRAEQVRPLLIGVISKFPRGQVTKALRLIVSGVVRVIVAGVRGGTFEKLYSDLAKMIHDGKIKNEAQLRAEMIKTFPNDETFSNAFTTLSVSKGFLARFYLREIEQYVNPSQTEWTPSESEDDVSLEHVLPLEWDEEKWPDFDAESHRAWRYRLGNQVLLAADDNAVAGNESFAKKLPGLKTSSFHTTNSIGRETKWTDVEIQKRQNELAALAAKTFPLTGEIRRRKAVAARVAGRRAKKSK